MRLSFLFLGACGAWARLFTRVFGCNRELVSVDITGSEWFVRKAGPWRAAVEEQRQRHWRRRATGGSRGGGVRGGDEVEARCGCAKAWPRRRRGPLHRAGGWAGWRGRASRRKAGVKSAASSGVAWRKVEKKRLA